MDPKKSPLSKEFKVACEIYYLNKHDKPATFSNLKETFSKFVTFKDKDLSDSIDTLLDWGILKINYDKNDRRRYEISNEAYYIIKDLYKHYWKRERNV